MGSVPTLFIVQIIISSYMLFLWIPRNTFLHFMHDKIPLFTWQFPRFTHFCSVLEQKSSFLDAGESTHSTSPTSELEVRSGAHTSAGGQGAASLTSASSFSMATATSVTACIEFFQMSASKWLLCLNSLYPSQVDEIAQNMEIAHRSKH